MSVAVGDQAPDFEAPSSEGRPLRLSALRGKKVILYFYPKAFTGGCTIETKQFGELAAALSERGVQVIGVSVDDAATQKKFADSCRADFPLIDDTSQAVSKSYGVLSAHGTSKRVTFFIDENGKVIDRVEAMGPSTHLERAKDRYLT